MSLATSGKPWLRAVLALSVTAVAVSACDAGTASVDDNTRQVTVTGSSQAQGVPDTLTVDAGIELTAPDVTTAMNRTNERQQAVINALTDAGVSPPDISTTNVSVQPQYGGGEGNITGYHAEHSIQVKVRKLDSASHVLAVIVSAGGDATRINSVRYSIENDSQLVKDARARAFNDARDRADQYARLSGLRLGEVISIWETSATPTPTPLPRAPMATEVPLEPGQQTVDFSVTAVWELD
ncbi:SIMPL domain-containing protein [Mycobacterium xenopi]|uniref:SIMPL domain-containing protein n=1 Tax=Mycobacterium xenopi TaxID=1789 RepID=UPI000587B837|nr:SIMPL domain-containing protein [Mycobacterium xenopi]